MAMLKEELSKKDFSESKESDVKENQLPYFRHC